MIGVKTCISVEHLRSTVIVHSDVNIHSASQLYYMGFFFQAVGLCFQRKVRKLLLKRGLGVPLYIHILNQGLFCTSKDKIFQIFQFVECPVIIMIWHYSSTMAMVLAYLNSPPYLQLVFTSLSKH